jgi:hypothetical protein
VAGGVYDENGKMLREFCYSIEPNVSRGSDADRAWVAANIQPIEITHTNIKSLRTEFWESWMDAKENGAVMAVECGWPVEHRFLTQCIDDDTESRKWEGPYPLHEISSIMLAAGMDPMATYDRLLSELPNHNPLADARQSARFLSEALKIINHP